LTELTVRSTRVLLPGGFQAATILVRHGRIASIDDHAERSGASREIDAGDRVIMPGLVDTHVHINEPGRTEWEGFVSGTRAAAAGGVTALVDMPLNSIPPVTTARALDRKIGAAEGHCHIDVGFWGGVVPGNTGELEGLAAGGVLGFKCFLSPSGVDEFEHVAEDDLRLALPVLARLGLPLLVHAELPAFLVVPDPNRDPRDYGTWLASRPPEAEHAAVDQLNRLAGEYGTHIHIVHLASAGAVSQVRVARHAGLPITVETCPHYLTFAAEEIANGATAFKCAPPIRERAHRDGLWQAIVDGDLDLIATDHSPAPASLKHLDDGNFVRAWGGIASLQLGLSVVWTAVAHRGISLESVVRSMTEAPARLAGFGRSKGTIAPGSDADLVVWDPDAETIVNGAGLHHRHPITPYEGMRLRGRVMTTILRGEVIFDQGRFEAPSGRCILGRAASSHGHHIPAI
jgi:allantoinase